MRLGAKILLLMLLITIGSSAIVTWLVTMRVTKYETERANDQISVAIDRYLKHLDDEAQDILRIVDEILGEPARRSLLQAADDPSGAAARAQLREEVFGDDLQQELASHHEPAAFHVLMNMAHDVVVVRSAGGDASLERDLAKAAQAWPVDDVIAGKPYPLIRYVSLDGKLFLTMGIPLREQLDEPPTHAYFAGFPIDDAWVTGQLLQEYSAKHPTIIPLEAWFVVDGKVEARGSSDPTGDLNAFGFDSAGVVGRVSFESGGEQFVGQAIDLGIDHGIGRLVLASSMDDALAPLRALRRSILWTTILACAAAVVACRLIAGMIAKPVRELVEGTHRIAAGQFDSPVRVQRHDELGELAKSFNAMSQGLKDREELLHQRVKTERDLAVARDIQTGGLPKRLPPCAGYDLAAMSMPAEQTGGDIYDVIAAGAGPIMLLLADATGHGIGSALSVTQMRAMLRIGLRIGAPLEDLLAQINCQLYADLGSSRFVTAFLGMLDPTTHRLTYHSAGQGPLLHYHARDGRVEWMQTSMPPLGITEESLSDGARHADLEAGDIVVLLTDGFYEFRNANEKLFGEDGVATAVIEMRDRTAREILDRLIEATHQFGAGEPQRDDMTGIVIRRVS